MTLKLKHDAPTESGTTIPSKSVVEHLGHVVGGMVKVLHNGREEIIHPSSTVELA